MTLILLVNFRDGYHDVGDSPVPLVTRGTFFLALSSDLEGNLSGGWPGVSRRTSAGDSAVLGHLSCISQHLD